MVFPEDWVFLHTNFALSIILLIVTFVTDDITFGLALALILYPAVKSAAKSFVKRREQKASL